MVADDPYDRLHGAPVPEIVLTRKRLQGESARRLAPCHGTISMPTKLGADPKWLCVAGDSEAVEDDEYVAGVVDTMFETLQMPPPRLIVSVTGYARDVPEDEMSAKQKDDIQHQLLLLGRLTHTWFVTGGTSGVAHLVGGMMMEGERTTGFSRSNVCLGVCPWGKLDRHEDMEQHARSESALEPFYYHQTSDGRGDDEAKAESSTFRERKYVSLDPYHTHHLCVDDGQQRFGCDFEMRAKVEDVRYMCMYMYMYLYMHLARHSRSSPPHAYGSGHVHA